jgi:hypothetical protein
MRRCNCLFLKKERCQTICSMYSLYVPLILMKYFNGLAGKLRQRDQMSPGCDGKVIVKMPITEWAIKNIGIWKCVTGPIDLFKTVTVKSEATVLWEDILVIPVNKGVVDKNRITEKVGWVGEALGVTYLPPPQKKCYWSHIFFRVPDSSLQWPVWCRPESQQRSSRNSSWNTTSVTRWVWE